MFRRDTEVRLALVRVAGKVFARFSISPVDQSSASPDNTPRTDSPRSGRPGRRSGPASPAAPGHTARWPEYRTRPSPGPPAASPVAAAVDLPTSPGTEPATPVRLQ